MISSQSRRRRHLLLALVAVLAIAIFLIDLAAPPWLHLWVLYLPLILASVWFNSTRQIVFVASACSVLVLIGCLKNPQGTTVWSNVANPGKDVLTVWLTALAGITIVRRTQQLSEVMEGLRRETAEHSLAKLALSQSEERFRMAAEGALMGTWDMNVITGTGIWSDTQFRILGLNPTPGGEVTLENWESQIHPVDLPNVLKVQNQARKTHTTFRCEHRAVRADNGETVWLAMFGKFLNNRIDRCERFVGVSFDITARKKLEQQVLDIAEKEQSRIGLELHDSVGQELTGLGMMANALAERLETAVPEKNIAARLVQGIDRVHRQVRSLSRGLVPVQLESKGLWAALGDLAASVGEQSGVEITFECPQRCDVTNHSRATELFRIAQEAVSNALRHGRPQHIRIMLRSAPEGLCLSVQDDGVGIQRQQQFGGMGLRIMEFRAERIGGLLQIAPAETKGTIVTCLLPGVSGVGKYPMENGSCDGYKENLNCG